MKRIANYLLSTLILAVVFTSCKKEENKIFFEGGTAPTLTANKTGNIPLSFANASMEAVKLSWTNPNYKFSTGLSSQDVFYKVEIDTTNAAGTINTNFTNPNKQTIGISKELSVSITQGQLNDYLLNQLQLVPSMVHYLQIRVVANLVNNNATLISNSIKITTTPYAIPPKVTPPASGKLFIVGSATPGGWNNPVPTPSQEFTQVSPTMYRINSLALTGSQYYLLLPVNGDWGTKYGAMGGNGSNNPDSDDFRIGGGDCITPAASGNYKIEVDFQRGKFILTKL